MIVDRAEHPEWLSNAYLVADRPGGHGVLVDSNGIVDPLLERIRSDEIEITHVLGVVCERLVDRDTGLPGQLAPDEGASNRRARSTISTTWSA